MESFFIFLFDTPLILLGEQFYVGCLAQGHFSHGFRGKRTSSGNPTGNLFGSKSAFLTFRPRHVDPWIKRLSIINKLYFMITVQLLCKLICHHGATFYDILRTGSLNCLWVWTWMTWHVPLFSGNLRLQWNWNWTSAYWEKTRIGNKYVSTPVNSMLKLQYFCRGSVITVVP